MRFAPSAWSGGVSKLQRKLSVLPAGNRDRKSTRLNSSHLVISYAVFCLKKKTSSDRRRPRFLRASLPSRTSPLRRHLLSSPIRSAAHSDLYPHFRSCVTHTRSTAPHYVS